MEQKKEKTGFLLHLVASWCFFLLFRVSNSQTCWESGHSLISCINFSATVVGTGPSNHTSPYLQQPKYAKIVFLSDPTSRNAMWHNGAPLLAMFSHLPMCQSSQDLDIWGHALEPKKITQLLSAQRKHTLWPPNVSNLWYEICPGPKLFVTHWASAPYVSLHLRYVMKLKDFTKLLEKADFNPSKCDLTT